MDVKIKFDSEFFELVGFLRNRCIFELRNEFLEIKEWEFWIVEVLSGMVIFIGRILRVCFEIWIYIILFWYWFVFFIRLCWNSERRLY